MARWMRYCAAASVGSPATSVFIGTRHQAVGVITRKSNAHVRSSSGSPSPSMSLYGWLCSHLGSLALISRQSSSARARRGSSGPASPGGGDGYITSQNLSARAPGSTDISACISVVPERGSPVTNSGRSITSSAIGWRWRSSKNSSRDVSSHRHTSVACRRPASSRPAALRWSTATANRAGRVSSPQSVRPVSRHAAPSSSSASSALRDSVIGAGAPRASSSSASSRSSVSRTLPADAAL